MVYRKIFCLGSAFPGAGAGEAKETIRQERFRKRDSCAEMGFSVPKAGLSQ